MGIGSSKPAKKALPPTKSRTDADRPQFDAVDLFRHLQENEGYEIYEFFERSNGGPVLAPVRLWTESFETPPNSSHRSNGSVGFVLQPSPGVPGEELQEKEGVSLPREDDDPWIVVSMPNEERAGGPPPMKGGSKGKGKGKAPGPPPLALPKGKGKSQPPLPPPPGSAGKGKGAGKGGKGDTTGPPTVAVAKKTPAPPPPFGKRLHWKLLPSNVLDDTIFNELLQWSDQSKPLDTQQFERLFAPPEGKTTPARERTSVVGVASGDGMNGTPSLSKKGGSGKAGSGQSICLLDSKRAQNMAIALRKVALPTVELAEVLRTLKLSHSLSAEALEHVLDNLLPTLIDSPELAEYNGPLENLRALERDLIPLARVPRLKARLQIMLFSKTVRSGHDELVARIAQLQSACDQVRQSGNLKRIIGTVLRVGNFLNHGIDSSESSGGFEVRGFAIESLLKLRDFRASHGSEVSALHCIALHLLPLDQNLPAQLRQELASVFKASEPGGSLCVGGIADLQDAVRSFQRDIALVQGEIDNFSESYNIKVKDGPPPLKTMQDLVKDVWDLGQKLEASFEEAILEGQKLLEYFGERRKTHPEETFQAIENFFQTLQQFLGSFSDCWKDVKEQPKKFYLDSGIAPPSRGKGRSETPLPVRPIPSSNSEKDAPPNMGQRLSVGKAASLPMASQNSDKNASSLNATGLARRRRTSTMSTTATTPPGDNKSPKTTSPAPSLAEDKVHSESGDNSEATCEEGPQLGNYSFAGLGAVAVAAAAAAKAKSNKQAQNADGESPDREALANLAREAAAARRPLGRKSSGVPAVRGRTVSSVSGGMGAQTSCSDPMELD